MTSNFISKKNKLLILMAICLAVGSFAGYRALNHFYGKAGSRYALTKEAIARAFSGAGTFHEFPSELEIPIEGQPSKVVVQYAYDAKLQETMQDLFRSYRPDYGAFVAVDATTGRVLSMVSYTGADAPGLEGENLALRATFPSASVFKVVTAAAAIAERNFSANTIIPFNGRNHTLYRGNVLRDKVTRWTRYITLKEAFAHSINTVFGKIGAFTVGAAELRQYAGRFGFNRTIAADVPLQPGNAHIPENADAWELAEAASGFTRENTMSPLQGALIAAAIVNDGVMMEPFVVQSVHKQDGSLVYEAEPKVSAKTVDAATAAEIRSLMRETVRRGTSRRSFAGFLRGPMRFVQVGGKTGSLTGDAPKGKYDWFVGYAENGSQRIAVAALTVHRKYWKVKSSYLARRAFERHFKDQVSAVAARR